MEHYWHLETWEKEIIRVKPDPTNIQYIQNLIAKGEGAIVTPTRTITIKSVKDFRLSDEVYADQKSLEDGSQAFKDPIIHKDGSVACRYVKKSVPQRMWDKYYKFHTAYRMLEMNDNRVTIAFIVPVELIDRERVQELSPEDERRLSKITA